MLLVLVGVFLATGISVGQDRPAQEENRWTSVSAARDTVVSRPTSQGEFNRRKRALQLRGSLLGRETGGPAAAGQADSTQYAADSTARLEQFVHQPLDPMNVLGQMSRKHPLYLSGPSKAAVTTRLDSTTWMYTVRYLLGAADIKSPVVVPFEDYVALRLDYEIRRNWEQILQTSTVQIQRKEGLGELFGKVTNIEIPVPKNPIFSIFGPNIIRLQINGRRC